MAIKYGSTTIESIIYAGVDLEKVYYGTTLVFDKSTMTHIAYDGSKFHGVLSSGLLTGFRVYISNSGSATNAGPLDGYQSGTTITSGTLKKSGTFNDSNIGHFIAGLVTTQQINLAIFKELSLSKTGQWRRFYVNSSQGTDVYYINSYPMLCTYDSDKKYYKMINGSSTYTSTLQRKSTSGSSPSSSGNQGYFTTSWTDVYDLTQATGSNYLFFPFRTWVDGHQSDLSLTLTQIKLST